MLRVIGKYIFSHLAAPLVYTVEILFYLKNFILSIKILVLKLSILSSQQTNTVQVSKISIGQRSFEHCIVLF